MNKLENKIFYTIFIIFEISIISFIVIYNTIIYKEQKNKIVDNLIVASDRKDNKKDNKFLDSTIYTLLIDENNNIKEIINNSNVKMNEEEILKLGQSILRNNPQRRYVGNLYFSKYSYNYLKNENLVIFDNTKIQKNLLVSLNLSLIVFILLSILIYISSKKITKWITEPVRESFEKQKNFVADSSHELKTPLSVIISST